MPLFMCPHCRTIVIRTALATYVGCRHFPPGQDLNQKRHAKFLAQLLRGAQPRK